MDSRVQEPGRRKKGQVESSTILVRILWWVKFILVSLFRYVSIHPVLLCCCSVAKSCLTLATTWTAAHQASLSFTISLSLLRPIFIELMMPSNHLILCHPRLLLPSIFPSSKVFSNESVLHMRWPKYWSFSLVSVLSMNTQDWSPLGWTGWISLLSKELSRVFSNTTVQKHSLALSFLYNPTLTSIHDYWKNHSLN